MQAVAMNNTSDWESISKLHKNYTYAQGIFTTIQVSAPEYPLSGSSNAFHLTNSGIKTRHPVNTSFFRAIQAVPQPDALPAG